jgi:flagellar hook-associated protein 3 FlgL
VRILPVSVQRTGDRFSQQRLVRQLQADQLDIQQLYDQISTGRSLLRMSDDPTRGARGLGLQRAIEYSQQSIRNADASRGFIAETDSATDDLKQTLDEAQGLAVQGVQTTLSQTERESLATQVEQLADRMVLASQRRYRDQFVLSGANNRPPLVRQASGIRYDGNGAELTTRVGTRDRQATGTSLDEALGVGPIAIAGGDLAPQVTAQTRLADLFRTQGIDRGVVELSAGPSPPTAVDLRYAETVGDVVRALDGLEVDGRELSASITTNGIEVAFADALPGTLVIRDVGSRMAEQLGIEQPLGGTAPVVSNDLSPAIRTTTRLADLRDGAGINVSAGIRIQQGNQTYSVDLSTAQTIEDVLVAIDRSGATVQAQIDPTTNAIVIRNRLSGVDLSIGENNGTVATDLGIRTGNSNVRLSELINGLGIGTVAGTDLTIVRTDGANLEFDLDGFTTVGEVINAINTHPANTGPATVTASMVSRDNGIRLQSLAGSQTLTVRQSVGSNAGEALGLIARGQTSVQGQLITAGQTEIVGRDFAAAAPADAVDTVLRLAQAIRSDDTARIEQLSARLSEHIDQVVLVRGQVGIKGQSIERLKAFTEDRVTELKDNLSKDIDADLTELISSLELRQTAMEASLRLVGETSRLSLLNFL